MNSLKALVVLFVSAVMLLLAIMIFNYTVDPQCYYRCDTVNLKNKTLNSYYKVAQTVVAQPDTEVVILGSSRGENTSPLFVQDLSGLKTINLSVSGAELTSKLAFLNLALEHTKLKKVIWLADYFEFITENRDIKISNTPALRKYVKSHFDSKGLGTYLSDLQGLINHNTLEASIYFLNHQSETVITQGAGVEIDYKKCDADSFAGKETVESLRNQIDIFYQNYTGSVLRPKQNENEWQAFEQELSDLSKKGIEVAVVIPPYHAEFIKRLKIEYPDLYQRHLAWVTRLKSLAGEYVKVVNYFDGIPGGVESPAYWNDGVHFTCKGSNAMLQSVVSAWKTHP